MNTDLSGCSKCRFSKRGCKRCRDPDFQARQLIRTAQLERHAAEKNHEVALKVSTHRREKLEDQSTRTRRAKKRTRQAEADAEAFQQELPNRGRDSIAAADPCATVRRQDPHEQADLVQKSRVQQSAKAHISSGLELGLTAGLLPLTGDSSEATQGLQNATLHQHGGHLPGQPSAELLSHAALTSSSDISCSSTQVATGAAVEVSRGGEAETSGMKERPEEQEARQRRFLGLLQSKMQQKQEERQQQGGARVERSLAAALALGARHRKRKKGKEDFKGDPRVSLWEPPQSPYGLIEEQLFTNPWKLLVACILLNKTSVVQVRKVIWNLFELLPTPEAAMEADAAPIRKLIEPLGLAPKRAPMLIRFSREYVEKQWTNPLELHGVGQYAADAYNIFCRGDWRSVSPKDKDLLRYHQWLTETGGEGTGLTRDAAPGNVHCDGGTVKSVDAE